MAQCGFKTDIKYCDEITGEHVPYEYYEPEENEGAIGGAVIFGLIIIALRRKFERKFRH